jgi:hypothetical protein
VVARARKLASARKRAAKLASRSTKRVSIMRGGHLIATAAHRRTADLPAAHDAAAGVEAAPADDAAAARE